MTVDCLHSQMPQYHTILFVKFREEMFGQKTCLKRSIPDTPTAISYGYFTEQINKAKKQKILIEHIQKQTIKSNSSSEDYRQYLVEKKLYEVDVLLPEYLNVDDGVSSLLQNHHQMSTTELLFRFCNFVEFKPSRNFNSVILHFNRLAHYHEQLILAINSYKQGSTYAYILNFAISNLFISRILGKQNVHQERLKLSRIILMNTLELDSISLWELFLAFLAESEYTHILQLIQKRLTFEYCEEDTKAIDMEIPLQTIDDSSIDHLFAVLIGCKCIHVIAWLLTTSNSHPSLRYLFAQDPNFQSNSKAIKWIELYWDIELREELFNACDDVVMEHTKL